MNIIFKKDTWQEIYYSLRNNKLRTFLTMIGVGWGMFLYVTLLGAAKGMENGFNKLFSSFATKGRENVAARGGSQVQRGLFFWFVFRMGELTFKR